MFEPVTTAGLIDAFESRFTTANGAHFLIAPKGKEAWPLSETESRALRALYRRRMLRARFIRRVALFGFIPLTILIGSNTPEEPRWLKTAFQTLGFLTMFILPLIGFHQHGITSDITKAGIARRLQRRITTRFEAAVTRVETPLARIARRAMILAGAILLAIEIGHMIGPRAEHAAHMRALTGLTAGNESLLARFTGILAWMLCWTLVIGAVLLWFDRRKRQRAAAGEAAEARAAGVPAE